ncbi:Predicted phosphohydrolase or phosphomutase, AlkP superfamily [Halovenus aranensis]|uniref:Predicted phosphohydrolase or phosphomutase, AlkP superfamily n=1 Tax=Halovenus aranensis TaxID=890420 RepID=A0A1G8VC34_9EURY|nr:alkaline phosphatase family protein [Halovenus aranensis]SDJ62700.1 Predicted phosphohydrolase or phosphomutase, AlkP superfamily [Halovenus aranensis]
MGLFDRLRGDDGPRVVFLGIDGVPYDLVEDHPDVFENLHAIATEGAGGQISSIVPPESSACWPALTTGRNPGETGVYGFQDRKSDSYETYVPVGAHVEAPRLWDVVTDADRNASVFNVPVTFPPSEDIQRQVSGFLSPSLEQAASDSELEATLSDLAYNIDVDASLGHDDDKTAFIESANETLKARYKAFRHYVEQDDWDLFFGVFMATDRVNHFLFRDYAQDGEYAAAFLEFYSTLDDYIGEIRAMLDDETELIIASDHGFTELHHEVKCNRWLAQQGWLTYDTDEPEELADIGDDARAYSLIPGRFYLNLEGREPGGVVPESEYETVREELIDDLETLTGPDGRAVCDRIVKGEEVFDGPHTEIAPDVVVVPADGFDLKAGFDDGDEIFAKEARNGMHKFGNACLYSTADLSLADVDLYDIAPTILDLMEVDADTREMEGRSLVG